MTIKSVLFDWGGVLVAGGRSFSAYVEDVLGAPIKDIEAFSEIRVRLNQNKITPEAFEAELLKLTGVAAIPEGFWVPTNVRDILPEMKHFTKDLRDQGYQTGIISNMGHTMAEAIRGVGGYDGFDPLVISCEVGLDKPMPAIYDLAVERSGYQPSEIVFVDDLASNLDYPKELGMSVVLATSPAQIIEEVTALLG